jgi:hypothetical protein
MDISILPEQIVGYASMVYPVLTCFVLQKMTTTVVRETGNIENTRHRTKTNKHTTMRKQTQTTYIIHELSYKQLELKT